MTRAERIEAAARELVEGDCMEDWEGDCTEHWPRIRALQAALSEPDPAPAGTVLVEHDVHISSFGRSTVVRADICAVITEGAAEHEERRHTVRVRYRVPLPAAPVVIEGIVVEEAP